LEPVTDKVDGEMGDVDADPSPIETLRGRDCCAATAEGV
jgi:hypothetical protein